MVNLKIIFGFLSLNLALSSCATSAYHGVSIELSDKERFVILENCQFIEETASEVELEEDNCRKERYLELIEKRNEQYDRQHEVATSTMEMVGTGLVEANLIKLENE